MLSTFNGTVLVLDLDETLVHIKRVFKSQPTSFGPVPPDFSWQPKHDDSRIYVGWKRPGFDTFFERIFEEVNAGNIFLCIWTTAARRYAVEALKRTLGEKFSKIGLLWTREQYQEFGSRKDLFELSKFLECKLSNMVMIDDNSLVFDNYLRAAGVVWLTPPFSDASTQHDDNQLERIVSALERRFTAGSKREEKECDACEEETPTMTKSVRKFRQVMVNWMTLLHLQFDLDDISLHVAIHVLDELFVHENDLMSRDPIAIATTCLYIGCCYGEASAISLNDWIKIAGGHIVYDDIVMCLQQINRTLAYPLIEIGDVPYIILMDYLGQFEGLGSDRARIMQDAQYVLELCLLDFRYREYDTTHLVWMILFFVTTRHDSKLWADFSLAASYETESSELLAFVKHSAVQGDRPMLGRNESNERYQRKFVSSYGVFASLKSVEIEV